MGKKMSKETNADMFEKKEETEMNAPVCSMKSFKEHIKKIDNAIANVKKSWFSIAFALEWIDRTQAYELGEYKNIVDFAEKKYSISKASTYNYINVASRFGKRNDNGDIDSIADMYKEYSPTQLMCLYESKATDSVIESLGISPDMTCAKIKSVLKALACNDTGDNGTGDNGTGDNGTGDNGTGDNGTGDNGTGNNGTDTEYSKVQTLLTISSIEDLDKQKSHIFDLIKKTLTQDGLECVVTLNMEWN